MVAIEDEVTLSCTTLGASRGYIVKGGAVELDLRLIEGKGDIL